MPKSKNTLIIGIFITVIIISAGIIHFTKSGKSNDNKSQTASVSQFSQAKEHTLGNPNAELGIYVYFDVNCPHCRVFHQTMHQFINKYGKNGRVKWVVKYLPLSDITRVEDETAECVAAMGGENSYWQFMDKLMNEEIKPSGSKEGLINNLIQMTRELGINESALRECVKKNPYADIVSQNRQEAMKLGATGTPFVVLRKGKKIIKTVSGALNYTELKNLVEENLSI